MTRSGMPAAQTATGVPVIAIDAAGFYGSKNLGNRLAGEVMVKRVIGQREPAPWPESTPFAPEQRHDIGLIGEFNIAGEFWHIQPLLDELGIRVLGSLSGDGRFAEIQTMHRAQANMLVCSRALINVARAPSSATARRGSKAASTGSAPPPTPCVSWRRCWTMTTLASAPKR